VRSFLEQQQQQQQQQQQAFGHRPRGSSNMLIATGVKRSAL
jgi:hypothetical protein